MKIRNQIPLKSLDIPPDHQKRKITDLIDRGLVTDMNEAGFPFYTTLGSVILNNIEKAFVTQANAAGFDLVCLPNVMSTKILEKGQEMGEQFRSKIMHLTESLKDYHVISSPEMLFVQWGRRYQISHHQLPIRYYYLNNLHRQKTNIKGALFPQQIKIFGGVAITKKDSEAIKEIELINEVICSGLNMIDLPYHVEPNYNGFDYEFFFLNPTSDNAPEGENILLPGVSIQKKTKAYSLGMIYNYPTSNEFRLRFRDNNNKNKKPLLITFGISTPRILHCLFQHHHDEKGFNLPDIICPFIVGIIPEAQKALHIANDLYTKLKLNFAKNSKSGCSETRVYIDERISRPVNRRIAFADYIGTQYKIIVKEKEFRVLHRDREGCQKFFDINQIINLFN